MTMKIVSASEDDVLPTSALQMTLALMQKRMKKLASWSTVSIQPPRYTMEIGRDKTKGMANNPNGFQREIKIKGQRLEEVENQDESFEKLNIRFYA